MFISENQARAFRHKRADMMLTNINRNTQAWVNEMRKHGYNNLMFYTSASWLEENNLGYRDPVSTSQFGIENF